MFVKYFNMVNERQLTLSFRKGTALVDLGPANT